MSTYKIEVTYGDGEPQATTGLSAEQAWGGIGAFMRDMVDLPGSVITRLTIEREAMP
jgi:hypothetical protein